jgi:diadenosine hexaphosphate hydrolase (ATP-forming)
MNQKKTTKKRPRNRAVKEYTAGGMVFRRTAEEVEILMIQDRLGRWTIPKGHVERGESLEQTALREVREETGLRELRIRGRLDKIHFFYRKEGKLILMTTMVFLMEAVGDSDRLVPENNEGIADVKWFSRQQALELIEYKDTERLFRIGLRRLQGGRRRQRALVPKGAK